MKITNNNYFSRNASREYMSVSQFKSFDKCEAMALAEIRGKYKRPETTALLVGSYVDAFYEGTLPSFINSHPELFKKDGSLKSEYVKAEQMIQRTLRDKLFQQYMSGRKQVILTGEIEGVPVKIKVDSLHDDKIVDLKCMRDFEPIYVAEQGRLPWFEAWRYDLQGAVYQEIVRQNTGEKLPFYLAAVTKEQVSDIDIIQIEQDLLDFELGQFKQNVARYDAIKKGAIRPIRCEHCDYCKETKKLKKPIASSLYDAIGE